MPRVGDRRRSEPIDAPGGSEGVRAPREGRRPPDVSAAIIGVFVVLLTVVLVAVALERVQYDVIIGILTVLSLTIVTVPLLRWVARREKDPRLLPIFYWALVAKFVGTLVRYFFITVIYNDNGDAGVYSSAGAILMESYRKGIFAVEVPGLGNRGAETARIAVVVGLVYLVTGVSRYAASFVFSWLCFMGQLLMFRAFKRGVPDGDHRRYAMLVLFLPSMVFWPSSIGKEALMVFFIGILCFGASQLLGARPSPAGAGVFALGAGGLFFIRPHMALIAITALAFAAAVSVVAGFTAEVDKKAKTRSFALRMGVLALLMGGGVVATTQVSAVLGGTTEGTSGITGVLARTKAQTAEGGSSFDAIAATSPVHFPAAAVTVLLRPFPWESHSLNGVIASSEGVLLGSLFVAGRRRVLAWGRALAKRPYLVFCLVYAVTFIVAFSYIGNFGILARQRTQMMPLALTMLGMPPAVRSRQTGAERRRAERAEKKRRAIEQPAAHEPLPSPVLTRSLQSSSALHELRVDFPRGDVQR